MHRAMDGVRTIQRGKVWLVGAGPGTPDLLTVRAYRLLSGASVVAHDELVTPEILAIAPPDAERIAVGRRADGRQNSGARIHPVVIERALAGQSVVRLKGGDPFVFGRGGEEAEELAAARIPFEVVPGVSAAVAAAATTHIPLTHRECASSVTLATAHAMQGVPDLRAAVAPEGTLVFYMALARVEETCSGLIASGRSPQTPAALVCRATLPGEQVIIGTLSDLGARVRAAGAQAPALLIVGPVVARRILSVADPVQSADPQDLDTADQA